MEPVIKLPRSPREWDALARKAIARATLLDDRRLHGLKAAIVAGKTAEHLRKMSIVSEADVLREFPSKAT